MVEEMPIFVKIDEYKDVLDVIDLLKSKIEQAKSLLEKIDALKNDENSELELWRTNIDDIERMMDSVDESLLKPENI